MAACGPSEFTVSRIWNVVKHAGDYALVDH